jgi:hypothetical protein
MQAAGSVFADSCALVWTFFALAVPVLGGRTALQTYKDLMVCFRDQFRGLLGVVVTDANVGLGPKGELRYPSNPLDSRWNFPGIGEFQVGPCQDSCWEPCHTEAHARLQPSTLRQPSTANGLGAQQGD